MSRFVRLWRHFIPAGCLALTACAVNPATGERQLSLISESREIEMGREGDASIQASFGVYDDAALAGLVEEMGLALAETSERPALPWSFKVLDDPVVNAFALPGGYIFVTRGILAHLASEAELAGVLGHEIGHVTARHSVNQLSRQQLQQIGLGVGMILSSDVRSVGDYLAAGLGLLNLKYGRDDERQSDELGVRYMTRGGYDPNELADVFRTLALVSGSPEDRLPEWQSTHPAPENREDRIATLIAESGVDYSDHRVGEDAYLRRLDGLVVGANPREGFFSDKLFRHPDLRFRVEFPPEWVTLNRRTEVIGVESNQTALLAISLVAGDPGARSAAAAFREERGIEASRIEGVTINGLQGASVAFRASTADGDLDGEATFIDFGGRTYRLLGYGTRSGWDRSASDVRKSVRTFREETDPDVLAVEPWRIDVVELSDAMSGADFVSAYPSVVESSLVYRINRIDAQTRLEEGRLMKRVVGRPLP